MLHRRRRHVDDPRGQPHLLAEPLEAAADHPPRAQGPPRLHRGRVAQVHRRPRIDAHPAQRRLHGVVPDHRHRAETGQIHGNRLGDAEPDPRVLLRAGDIGERDDGHGVAGGRGRLPCLRRRRDLDRPAAVRRPLRLRRDRREQEQHRQEPATGPCVAASPGATDSRPAADPFRGTAGRFRPGHPASHRSDSLYVTAQLLHTPTGR